LQIRFKAFSCWVRVTDSSPTTQDGDP
jgi:hypothetical protein